MQMYKGKTASTMLQCPEYTVLLTIKKIVQYTQFAIVFMSYRWVYGRVHLKVIEPILVVRMSMSLRANLSSQRWTTSRQIPLWFPLGC